MGLYKEWTDLLQGQTDNTFKKFWEEYSKAESTIYDDILKNNISVFQGRVSDLCEKYGIRHIMFAGFLDGISSSITNEIDLDNITSDSEVSLNIDFEKLLFNMFQADADYLYTLESWNNIFDDNKKKDIADSYRRSRTIVKGDKIGRNDPCPCGSSKKYKKCCGK